LNELDNIIAQLERQRLAIDDALKALRGVAVQGVGADPIAAVKKTRGRPKGTGKKKRRPMSAEGRKRIGEAQRARWAAQKAGATKKKATK
jgi:hypothetical protein